MSIMKIAVIGGGAMGHGIAVETARRGGLPVVIKEMNDELAAKALGKAHAIFDRWAEKGKMDQTDAEGKKSLITATSNYADLADVDLVIEAVPENLSLKMNIWTELDKVVKPEALFASNTSSLSIAELAKSTDRSDKFAGLHFFNPPTAMKLVELVKTGSTSEATLRDLKNFTEDLGKTVIQVKDVPGFLVNRLLMPYLNSAAKLLCEKALEPEELDTAAVELGWPMGPFLLMDMVGLDVGAEVADVLYRGYGERMKPSPLLRMLVDAGRTGRKTGAGFYVHDGRDRPAVMEMVKKEFPNRSGGNAQDAVHRMMDEMALEALRCQKENVASDEDIEIGCAFGIGYPQSYGGPLGWAKKEEIYLSPKVSEK